MLRRPLPHEAAVADEAEPTIASRNRTDEIHVAPEWRTKRKILVIKHGALSEFVQAMGSAAAIRAHHADADITVLTTAPFAELARAAPYFDRVWIDDLPGPLDLGGLWQLRQRLCTERFDRIYDLQMSRRTGWYFHLLGPGARPEWSGIVPGCSHPADPGRDRMHILDRQAGQLRRAGIEWVPPPDLSWAKCAITRFDLPNRFLILVPGGSRDRPERRWPAGRYAQLADLAAKHGLTPVIVGGAGDHEVGREIVRVCPTARDLTGRTSLGEIAGLGAAALFTVGNDTGPVHVLAAAGSPVTVLYSGASDPALVQPRGRSVIVLQRPSLADLAVDEVAGTLHLS